MRKISRKIQADEEPAAVVNIFLDYGLLVSVFFFAHIDDDKLVWKCNWNFFEKQKTEKSQKERNYS